VIDVADCGPLQLVVIQPTPYCNINCSYCYLKNRRNKGRITPEILEATFRKVFTSPFVQSEFTVTWHAGEPLIMGVHFYEEAIQLIASLTPKGFRVRHAIQSNGTLLNEAWLDLIERHRISFGLSLDGPAHLHDRNRKTWDGRGTHDRAMQAVSLLHARGLPFSVIAVVSNDTLDHADEFYSFFRDAGIRSLGLNVEEIEGVHLGSTLEYQGAEERYRAFLERLSYLCRQHPSVRIREFTIAELLLSGQPPAQSQTVPFRVLNVDYKGNFSTFSPELLDARSPEYGDFLLGNVLEDELQDALSSYKLGRIYRDITAGINSCAATCEYFAVCGGGTPGNKLFEHGTFSVTETMHCRLTQQVVHEVVATDMLIRLSKNGRNEG
jgi:uncharacterized protein